MDAWHGRRVLVTGAGGFIGSHLAAELVTRGAQVTALVHYHAGSQLANLDLLPPDVRAGMTVRRSDVRDAHAMLRAAEGMEVVFHLAALIAIPYSYEAPSSYVATNVTGTLHVLEACRHHQTPRMVHTSTSECYGTARYVPIDESHPLQGQSPYSASKIGADMLAESYFRSFGLPVATLRPFNTFGPRQSARAIIPTIFCQLLSGTPELRLGSLDPVRDMNYVDNTVDAYLAIATCDAAVGEVVNAGSGEGRSIGDIAQVAMQVTGRSVPIVRDQQRVRPEESEVMELVCNHEKAQRLLGWRAKASFREGMERTAEFIGGHPELYRSAEYAR